MDGTDNADDDRPSSPDLFFLFVISTPTPFEFEPSPSPSIQPYLTHPPTPRRKDYPSR